MRSAHRIAAGIALIIPAFLLACCSPATSTVQPSPAPTRSPVAHATIAPTASPTITPTSSPPFWTEWEASAHAQADSPAFRYWDTSVPAQIPADCARCHSTVGFLNFLGADGSPAGLVDGSVEAGSLIDCEACHNPAAEALDSLTMPSGAELSGLGSNTACVLCHQGRTSGADLKDLLKSLAPKAISPGLAFVGVHYGPAGAVLFGSEAGGGYEYPSRAYAGRFQHALGYDTCTGCHDAHALAVNAQACGACHAGIESLAGVQSSLRVSTVDYDGDGDTAEGLAGEIETLQTRLLAAITSNADRFGFPIQYRADQDPFFFDPSGEPYRSWTPFLLQAAYNYQLARMDPGAYAHNPKYIMQLLYDSIQAIGGDHLGLVRP